ncbi:MAG: hypothetical protein IH787_08190 [Nitrospirae bacterium]|nr:hypothetical protein [Nitrospirota bacterium]
MTEHSTKKDHSTVNRRCRHRLALIVLLFQTFAATLAPVVHASTEALGSDPTIEAKHSSECVPVHDEARCVLTMHSQQGYPESRALAPATPYRRLAGLVDSPHAGTQRINPSSNGERAPPSR